MVRLTVVSEVLTEEAEKRLVEYESFDDKEDFWEKLGLPNPEKGGTDTLDFKDEDYKKVEGFASVREDSIDLIIEHDKPKDGCTVFLDSGKNFIVKQSLNEIEEIILKNKWYYPALELWVKIKSKLTTKVKQK
jgi:uncharacterized protein YlzI (FlbEa/FlbD family)